MENITTTAKADKKQKMLKIADRFFNKTNELPHEIAKSHKEDGWQIYTCKSANFTHQIATKELFNQVILWA